MAILKFMSLCPYICPSSRVIKSHQESSRVIKSHQESSRVIKSQSTSQSASIMCLINIIMLRIDYFLNIKRVKLPELQLLSIIRLFLIKNSKNFIKMSAKTISIFPGSANMTQPNGWGDGPK